MSQYGWHTSCIAHAQRRFVAQPELHDMPMRGELPTAAARLRFRAHTVAIAWSRCRAFLANPDLQGVVAFCLIGFLAALNVILRFPDFGAYYVSLPVSP
jgi:hypothetical protein